MPPDFERLIAERLNEGAELRRAFARAGARGIQDAAAAVAKCLEQGNKVLTLGNGGSAADAQHFAAELVGRFTRDRVPLPAIALTTDASALTAIGNDYGFEEVFARQVRAIAQDGDVVVAISTSGRSPNVVSAAKAARAVGATTIALTGGDGGELVKAVEIAIVVPSSNTARIQEVHSAVVHILCELVEASLFSDDEFFPSVPSGVVQWNDLVLLRRKWKQDAKIVVWTNGCFDLLHVGHLHSLEQAKRLGDVLVVGVNTDASVSALKGPDRPMFPLAERMRILAALGTTDYIVAFDGITPETALAELKPDIHVKGADYAPPSGKPMPERHVIESYGGRIEFVGLIPNRSTSELVTRVRTDPGEET
jgi:phosphoheptose isomerase